MATHTLTLHCMVFLSLCLILDAFIMSLAKLSIRGGMEFSGLLAPHLKHMLAIFSTTNPRFIQIAVFVV